MKDRKYIIIFVFILICKNSYAINLKNFGNDLVKSNSIQSTLKSTHNDLMKITQEMVNEKIEKYDNKVNGIIQEIE